MKDSIQDTSQEQDFVTKRSRNTTVKYKLIDNRCIRTHSGRVQKHDTTTKPLSGNQLTQRKKKKGGDVPPRALLKGATVFTRQVECSRENRNRCSGEHDSLISYSSFARRRNHPTPAQNRRYSLHRAKTTFTTNTISLRFDTRARCCKLHITPLTSKKIQSGTNIRPARVAPPSNQHHCNKLPMRHLSNSAQAPPPTLGVPTPRDSCSTTHVLPAHPTLATAGPTVATSNQALGNYIQSGLPAISPSGTRDGELNRAAPTR